jgi:hypothetical protein
MGLLWTFMGHSWAYSAFTGGVEMLGGFLLFFRRTTTLGALIIAGVMLNVLMLNLCFDVPVKLYSTHYLVFAAALAAPDLRRVANVLVFNRPAAPVSLAPLWVSGRLGRLVPVVRLLVVAGIVWYVPIQRTWRWVERPRPPVLDFHGVYDVQSFARDGVETPPLTTDPLRWRRVGFDARGRLTVVFMNDTRTTFVLQRVPGTDEFVLVPLEGDYGRGDVLTIARGDGDRLSIAGTLDRKAVVIGLSPAGREKLLLREREFRWISDHSFKR